MGLTGGVCLRGGKQAMDQEIACRQFNSGADIRQK
jgi:hypothetical protein